MSHTDVPATYLRHFRWALPFSQDCGAHLSRAPRCLLQNTTFASFVRHAGTEHLLSAAPPQSLSHREHRPQKPYSHD